MDNLSDFHVLVAPASATILTAKAFAAELLEVCESHANVAIDISGVTQADLSFLQTIHAAERHVQTRGGALVLIQPASKSFTDLLNSAGFSADNSDTDFWFKGAISQ